MYRAWDLMNLYICFENKYNILDLIHTCFVLLGFQMHTIVFTYFLQIFINNISKHIIKVI